MIATVIRWSANNLLLVILGAALAAFGGAYALVTTPVDAIPDLPVETLSAGHELAAEDLTRARSWLLSHA